MKKHEGNLIIEVGDTRDFSELQEVTGTLYIYSNTKLDALTSVGGSLYIYSNTKLDALTSVGGYLYIYSNTKLDAPFTSNVNYKSVDGHFFVIQSTKTKGGITIHSGYNARGVKKGKLVEQPTIYVAEKGDFYAHGETIKKAIEDLNFKIASETLKKEPINKDTKLTINHYRLITGACELGVKEWMKSNNVKEGIKAIDLLPILEKTHAYGTESFKNLITF